MLKSLNNCLSLAYDFTNSSKAIISVQGHETVFFGESHFCLLGKD